ncbi:unnamed protein product [Effrenium voratum]|nr:unnamed protein product [Effrenium voratum]
MQNHLMQASSAWPSRARCLWMKLLRERDSASKWVMNMSSCWTQRKAIFTGRPYYPCIVKTFKRSHAKHAGEWHNDLQVLDRARDMAERFNRTVSAQIKIQFASAFLYQVSQEAKVYDGVCRKRAQARSATVQMKIEKGDRVCVEPELEGDFIKANCNNGFARRGDKYLEVAQAFSHWTWWVTEAELLICDLQGVHSELDGVGCWKFTDPAIHCSAGRQRFGQTDLGPRGINAFFRSHQCNKICRRWKKPETVIDIGMPPVASHTTFSFELARVSDEVHSQRDFADILDHAHTGTCYAQASATIIRAAERRIVGRRLEKHHVMAQRFVSGHGTDGAPSQTVLNMIEQECKSRCLRCHSTTDAVAAAAALDLGRAIYVSFALDDEQWKSFSSFFKKSPSAVLRELPANKKDNIKSGHGAVIVGHDNEAWKIRGDEFADGGFFRISKAVLQSAGAFFIDVYFLEAELRPDDKAAYADFLRASPLRTL